VNIFEEKLSWFKQNEKPETVLLIADNPERIKLVIAWTNCSMKQSISYSELKGKSENDTWNWLWENVSYSATDLKEKSDTPSEIVLENRIKPLIGNRIIYPDGTMNSYVQRYLRDQVLRLFDSKPKKPTKKSKE
jgi:hypothetical protein